MTRVVVVTPTYRPKAKLAMLLSRSSLRIPRSALARAFSGGGDDALLRSVDYDTGVAELTINRPKALNALNTEVITSLRAALREYDADDRIRCYVLTGSEKAFAAGADIKEMLAMDYHEMATHDRNGSLLGMAHLSALKPIVGCVQGFAFGGGCEVAMLCDILIAADNAKFGQPEVNLGIIAGAGGTQRLTHAVGKSLSMQMHLTGEPISAERAMQAGLVSEVVPADEALDRARAIAAKIASKSLVATTKIKDCVLSTFDLGLTEGVKAEHNAFISCWATEDQTEGMTAFADKRKPEWKHR